MYRGPIIQLGLFPGLQNLWASIRGQPRLGLDAHCPNSWKPNITGPILLYFYVFLYQRGKQIPLVSFRQSNYWKLYYGLVSHNDLIKIDT